MTTHATTPPGNTSQDTDVTDDPAPSLPGPGSPDPDSRDPSAGARPTAPAGVRARRRRPRTVHDLGPAGIRVDVDVAALARDHNGRPQLPTQPDGRPYPLVIEGGPVHPGG